jgi:hypothetical protein
VAQLGKFLSLISGKCSVEQAFQEAFAMSIEKMEKELREYIGL